MTALQRHSITILPRLARLLAVLLLGVLAGCARAPAAEALPGPSETSPPAATVTSTASLSPTPSATATATPSPTVTRTPTVTTTPTQTPFPWPATRLNPSNAAAVSLLKSWGQGAPLGQQRLEAAGRILLETALGLYLYDPQGSQPVARLDHVEKYVISPDETVLVTSSLDRNRLSVWDLRSGAALGTLEYTVTLPEFPPEGFDPAVFAHPQALVFSPDGSRLAVSFGDTSIVIWDTSSWQLVQVLESNVTNVADYLAFSPDNRLLVSSGFLASLEEFAFAPRLQVWDLLVGELVGYIPNPGRVADRPFSPDGQLLVTGSEYRLFVWRLPQAELLSTFASGAESSQPEVTFSASGEHLIVEGRMVRRLSDGTRLLAEEEAQVLAENAPRLPEVEAASLDPQQLSALRHLGGLQGAVQLADRSLLAWGVQDTRLYWWRLPENTLTELDLGGRPISPAALSPDRTTLAICLADEMLLVDWTAGEIRARMPGCRNTGVLAYLPDGTRLARARDQLVELLDPQTGEVINTLRSHALDTLAVGVANDGSLLASGSRVVRTGAEVFLWQLDPPAISARWYVSSGSSGGGVVALEFSPDLETLAVVMNDGFVKLYRVDDGWQLHNLAVEATCAAFSPDGALLAIGTRQGLVLAEVDSGQVLAQLPEPADAPDSQLGLLTRARLPGRLTSVSFVEGGAGVLTTASDGTVRLWGLP